MASMRLPQGQTVFLLGGNNGKEWLKLGDTFTPSINTWSAGAINLPHNHGYGAAAALGRSIYLVGGGQGETWLSSVLRYDVDDQAWFEVGKTLFLTQQRYTTSHACISIVLPWHCGLLCAAHATKQGCSAAVILQYLWHVVTAGKTQAYSKGALSWICRIFCAAGCNLSSLAI